MRSDMTTVTKLKTGKPTARELLAGVKVIDADTHFSEPWDLWTSRAPKDLKDRVPQVRTIDGELQGPSTATSGWPRNAAIAR